MSMIPQHQAIAAAALAAALAAPAAHAGAMAGGASEWTQIANNIQLIQQTAEFVENTSNNLMSAQNTLQMLKSLPDTVVNEITTGLPLDKVQALADAYKTFSRARDVYSDAQRVLDDARREAELLQLGPAEYLRARATAAQALGGSYRQQYESEIDKLDRLARTARDVTQQAQTIKGINSGVGGLQTLASQNIQIQTLLADVSSSIAQANAAAAQQAERDAQREQRGAEAEAKLLDARDAAIRAQDTAPARLRMPSEQNLVK